MLIKHDPRIINEPLLESYVGKPCILTGSTSSHAHHRCKRSKCRLDVPENLVPLDDRVNSALEDGFESFKEVVFLILGLYPSVDAYNELIDADNSVYNQFKGKEEISITIRSKKRRKVKIPSRKLQSRPFPKSATKRKKMS